MLAIQQRLEDQVAEPQRDQVLHRLLAEVMVDPVDLAFVEVLGDHVLDAPGILAGIAERLLQHHAQPRRIARPLDQRHQVDEARRRQRRVVNHRLRLARHRLVEAGLRRRVAERQRDRAEVRLQRRQRLARRILADLREEGILLGQRLAPA